MIDTGEKFLDVALQNPTGSDIIPANLTKHEIKSINRPVRPLLLATRVRIENKFFIEKWIQNSVNRVMQKPVANRGLADIPRLGI